MSERIDIDKIHRLARPIWKKFFRHTMTYDSYIEMILRYNIQPLHWMRRSPADRKIFMNAKNQVARMTLNSMQKLRD
jgi:hypothetical protein